MKTSTYDILQRLSESNLFMSCGGDPPEDCIRSNNISEAVKSYCSRSWENFRNEIWNRHSEMVWESCGQQDEVLDAVSIEIEKFVADKLTDLKGSFERLEGENDKIARSLRYDLLNIAFEVEYAELIDPIFSYRYLYPVYQSGFLPCGWVGESMSKNWQGSSHQDLPQGRLEVY